PSGESTATFEGSTESVDRSNLRESIQNSFYTSFLFFSLWNFGLKHQKTEVAVQSEGEITLEYCSAVRGILTDDQGGPLHPPGLRMAEGLNDVKASLDRNLEAKKGGMKMGS
ncbi:MAG: hypothetical protein HQM09_03075, partial [Candidatus Riflebacteria bacterium]|nr:hypothetical protein [Candidatus Riflebacteria bacterium]